MRIVRTFHEIHGHFLDKEKQDACQGEGQRGAAKTNPQQGSRKNKNSMARAKTRWLALRAQGVSPGTQDPLNGAGPGPQQEDIP